MKFPFFTKSKSRDINFIFVRHGFACHNAINLLSKNGYPNIKNKRTPDPELTDLGVKATAHNGCVLAKFLNSVEIDKIHLVGSSPLIRSMETAYYITSKWKKQPSKIYVLPYLRELDESTVSELTATQNRLEEMNKTSYLKPKFSYISRQRINTHPVYAMKSLEEQQKYFETLPFSKKLDFKYVQTSLRNEPGDIFSFIDWAAKNKFFYQQIPEQGKSKDKMEALNILIITHAGVLRDFYLTQTTNDREFANNGGFILPVNLKNNKKIKFRDPIIIPDTLQGFYSSYGKAKSMDYYCPSGRCGFCEKVESETVRKDVGFNWSNGCDEDT